MYIPSWVSYHTPSLSLFLQQLNCHLIRAFVIMRFVRDRLHLGGERHNLLLVLMPIRRFLKQALLISIAHGHASLLHVFVYVGKPSRRYYGRAALSFPSYSSFSLSQWGVYGDRNAPLLYRAVPWLPNGGRDVGRLGTVGEWEGGVGGLTGAKQNL